MIIKKRYRSGNPLICHNDHFYYIAGRRPPYNVKIRNFCLTMAGLVLMLAFSAGYAWSFESKGPDSKSVSVPNIQCRSHLEAAPQHTQSKKMQQYRQFQKNKAGSFGFVLGVKIALNPPKARGEKTGALAKPQLDFWQPEDSAPNVLSASYDGHRNALAMRAYKKCQKQQALKALADFRWSR